MQEDSCKRTSRRRKRERVGAQAVYIDTSLLSQREPFWLPPSLRGFMKSKKWKAIMESEGSWRGSGLADRYARA
jgi:hypothetical protein